MPILCQRRIFIPMEQDEQGIEEGRWIDRKDFQPLTEGLAVNNSRIEIQNMFQ